jgi:hypothetical protein
VVDVHVRELAPASRKLVHEGLVGSELLGARKGPGAAVDELPVFLVAVPPQILETAALDERIALEVEEDVAWTGLGKTSQTAAGLRRKDELVGWLLQLPAGEWDARRLTRPRERVRRPALGLER